VAAYIAVLRAPVDVIAGQIYNAGYENQPVSELAEIVRQEVGADVKLTTTSTDDNRSYHISSQKIKEQLGFRATFNINKAVKDLLDAFEKGWLPNSLEDEIYFNIRRMQSLNLQ